MTATTRFIEDAIKGGWDRDEIRWYFDENGGWDEVPDLVFLDPLAWQAVGKTRGWTEDLPSGKPSTIGWQHEWHRFIDALADGKDIEKALQVIE